ncbi:MAG: ABC transporter ATP-binding protein [Desulfobacula sp.]|jgi:ABC-type polysaccharide/polyol phosphate transport system ATPase subunit|nr:ABC transporter ATP-binding protein [Desulfobacula sp.]
MTKLEASPCESSTALQPVMVSFDNVSLFFQRHTSLFDLLFSRKKKQLFWALKNVSFQLREGDTMGIIGRNGSGKSTLSMVCTKIYPPDEGCMFVNGKVQLLALGVGFQKQLSGRENVYISGSLLGLKKSEISRKMDGIEDFADIGAFMDEAVYTYSSGMKSRLAFAIATAIQPDILILDEVMATGDSSFREKAMERIKNLHALTRCAIIVSHNSNQLKKICNRAIWLEKGRVVMQGESRLVLNSYQKFCKNPQKWQLENPEYFPISF